MSYFITLAQKYHINFIRLSLFVIYFWFGILKIIGTSAANPLVGELLEKTLPFLTMDQFIIFFSLFEVVLGIMFLFPKLDKITFPLLALHLITTAGPLVLLPKVAWQSFLTPTLEGQYIIKNLLIIASALTLLAQKKEPQKIGA